MPVCKVTAMTGSIGSGVHMDQSDQVSRLVKVSNHEANSVRKEAQGGWGPQSGTTSEFIP